MKGYLENLGDPIVGNKISVALSNDQNNLKNTLNPLVRGENMAIAEVHVWVTFYPITCSSSIFF